MVDTKKLIKYEKEQKEIFNKLLELLNYNNNYTFLLYDLDNNTELQNNIINLSNDIKKHYASSVCTGINAKECKRPYLSIIKYLLKFHNKEVYIMDHKVDTETKKGIHTRKYKIVI